MDDRALLVRYQALAANRRHFELLFFAVVAFSAIYGLAIGAALHWALDCSVAGPLAASTIFGGGGFIAHRLLKRERSSFVAMNACWHKISGELLPAQGSAAGAGAMSRVVVSLYAAGATPFVLACTHLIFSS